MATAILKQQRIYNKMVDLMLRASTSIAGNAENIKMKKQKISTDEFIGFHTSETIAHMHSDNNLGYRARTACTVLCLQKDSIRVYNIGSNRIYLLRNKQFIPFDSHVRLLNDLGISKEKKKKMRRYKHNLKKYLGPAFNESDMGEFGTQPIDAKAGDVFLICNRVLTNIFYDAEIANVMCDFSTPEDIVAILMDLALDVGSEEGVVIFAANIYETDEKPPLNIFNMLLPFILIVLLAGTGYFAYGLINNNNVHISNNNTYSIAGAEINMAKTNGTISEYMYLSTIMPPEHVIAEEPVQEPVQVIPDEKESMNEIAAAYEEEDALNFPETDEAPEELRIIYRVSDDVVNVLNLRSGPSTADRSLKQLRAGDEIKPIHEYNGWMYVFSDGVYSDGTQSYGVFGLGAYGYVSSEFIERTQADDTDDVSGVREPPLQVARVIYRVSDDVVDVLNLRRGPSMAELSLKQLRAGDEVIFIYESNGWMHVFIEGAYSDGAQSYGVFGFGAYGYVYSEFIERER